VQVTPKELFIVEAGGDNPARVHDGIALTADPAMCHLFRSDGRAVGMLARHPLAA
jgi:hypothetical protein